MRGVKTRGVGKNLKAVGKNFAAWGKFRGCGEKSSFGALKRCTKKAPAPCGTGAFSVLSLRDDVGTVLENVVKGVVAYHSFAIGFEFCFFSEENNSTYD